MKSENKKKFPKSLKITLISLVCVISLLLVSVIGYVVYFVSSYSRIEDNIVLEVVENGDNCAKLGEEYKIITYNIGFAAYIPEYSFFMDGGKYGRAFSKESVIETMNGIGDLLLKENADFLMIEEVDTDSDRSYHVNQSEMLTAALSGYSSVYAENYNSPYICIPFGSPHGSAKAGMLTLSKYSIKSSVRRSLPVEDSIMKHLDLDRCYTVSRVNAENGKELVLFTVHLSAYTSDGKIATEQLKMLIADMSAEYGKGNYVICGGDFNKDLLGDSSQYFGISDVDYTWAQPIEKDLIEAAGFSVKAPLDPDDPIPTCRNADAPYHKGQFVVTVDGFIVSDNIKVNEVKVADAEFTYSDHNPVSMSFELLDQ